MTVLRVSGESAESWSAVRCASQRPSLDSGSYVKEAGLLFLIFLVFCAMGEHMGIWEEISPLLQSPHSLLSTWSWLPALKKRTALSYRWNKGPVVIWQHIDATRSQVWSGVSEPRTSKSSILLVIIS